MTSRFAFAILACGIAAAQTAAPVAAAVNSPDALAAYVSAHPSEIDWPSLWRALHLPPPKLNYPLCGREGTLDCSAEVLTVPSPQQTIVLIRSGGVRTHDIYFRYFPADHGAWRFAGVTTTNVYDNDPRLHELMKVGGKPFLRIANGLSQVGLGQVYQTEDWYDLTQAEFKPVFSFTTTFADGLGQPFRRTVTASAAANDDHGRELATVELTATFFRTLDNEELGVKRFRGVYHRVRANGPFQLQEAYLAEPGGAAIPLADFRVLSTDTLAAEQLIRYTQPRLEEIARGPEGDAKQNLRDILNRAGNTPEKRTLLKLLAAPR